MNTLLRQLSHNASPSRAIHVNCHAAITRARPRPSRCFATRKLRTVKPSSPITAQSPQGAPKAPVEPEPPKHDSPPPPPPLNNGGRGNPQVRATLRDVGIGLFITANTMLFLHYIASHYYVVTFPTGASMIPTIYFDGECILISHLHRYGKGIKVGDVICSLHPLFPEGTAIVKRVVGMPGDFVWVHEGPPRDWHEADGMGWVGEPGRGRMIQVPKGHCWVLGDNQAFSRDSRLYGPLPLGLITGKIVWRIWPLRRWGPIANIMEEVDEEELFGF